MNFLENIINTETIENPWQYKIIDNFLPEELLLDLIEQINLFYSEKEDNRAKILMMKEALNLGMKDNTIEKIVDFCDVLIKNINSIIANHQTNNFTKGTYFIIPKFGITGKNFIHKIHDENPFKVLNIVTYLYPNVAKGTILYAKNDENSLISEIPWKTNRAFLSYPVKGKSWHNWMHLNDDRPRVTLNMFFEKIEGMKNTMMGINESPENILWLYEQFGKEKLMVTI
jgi:hypothetical protein